MQKKFLKFTSLLIFLQIFCCIFFLFSNQADAADSYTLKKPFGTLATLNFNGTTRPIAEYIQAIYKYAIGIVAILATVVMMIGGVVWMTAAGDSGRIGEAKQYITGALTGLVLALCSFMILQTVNPDLVSFKPIGVANVEQIKTSARTAEESGSICSWQATGASDCSSLTGYEDGNGKCAGQGDEIYKTCCCRTTCKTYDCITKGCCILTSKYTGKVSYSNNKTESDCYLMSQEKKWEWKKECP